MNEKLLPCPFCDGEARVYQAYDSQYTVQCDKCGATMIYDNDKGYVIEAWNRRAERTGRWIEDDTVYCGAGMRWFKCDLCNERVFTAIKGSKGYRFCPNCGAKMEGEPE